MSQQGGRPTGHEDDWWRQLYDDSTADTGPTAAADSLDDRFASASGALDRAAGPDLDLESDPEPNPEPDPVPDPEPESGPDPDPESDLYLDLLADGPPTMRLTASGGGAVTGSPAAAPRPAAAPAGPEPGPAAQEPGPASWWQRAPWEAPQAASPPPPAGPAAPAGPPGPGPVVVAHVGSGPPTYDAEPTALPAADPDALDDLVPDTVVDGARYGACTLRAVSVRGDSPRYRGEPRRDALLTARFGAGEQALILVAMATGVRARPGAHRAAAEVCRWIARAVGRSHVRLAEDIRAARRGELKSGLQRLTDRSLGRLRAGAVEQGLAPEEYTATLRCLLLPADPHCRTRVFFGVGEGGLFRLRDGAWQDIEPGVTDEPDPSGQPGPHRRPQPPHPSQPSAPPEPSVPSEASGQSAPPGGPFTPDLGVPAPQDPRSAHAEESRPPHAEPFRFHAWVARPGDTLLMCTGGLAEPLRGEAEAGAYLARRWAGPAVPGLAAFLADAQVRVKGYADDRSAAAIWEA
ncbi:protein phosphatase 2C domain-containing protein [Streptomyces sp. PsTaAH-124]|uniref:protein phosphatase 2C domain-containing protein n=1 Tax=Streptomyces sp. PsTaAH-124 TaxID=1157638 RepID=UPI00039B1B0A|nr:protein phosphatase 2C domain-containing protein [Streptomyces sp. PsTaAH-124]